MANMEDYRNPDTGRIDWDAYDLAEKQDQKKELADLGFPEDLTDDQLYVIRKPMDAPEDYHCDGEITAHQAKVWWLQQLREAGLTPRQVQLARQYNGI